MKIFIYLMLLMTTLTVWAQNNVCMWECSRNPNGSTCQACKGAQNPRPQPGNPHQPPKPKPKPGPITPRSFLFDQPVVTLVSTITNLVHPESVLVDDQSLWISDMGKDTSKNANGDGALFKYSLDGQLDTQFHLKTKLDSPMGMAIVNSVLYTADINRVVGIDTKSGELVTVFDFSPTGTRFLNDVVAIDANQLIVTATDIKKIYLINLKQNKAEELKIDFHNYAPNGVYYDKKTSELYFAANAEHTLGENGNGKVMKYYLSGSEAKFIKELSVGKFLDGIFVKNESIYVSDWYSRGKEGKLYVLDKEQFTLINEIPMGTSGLADIDYNSKNNLLVTPDLIEGSVRLYKLY